MGMNNAPPGLHGAPGKNNPLVFSPLVDMWSTANLKFWMYSFLFLLCLLWRVTELVSAASTEVHLQMKTFGWSILRLAFYPWYVCVSVHLWQGHSLLGKKYFTFISSKSRCGFRISLSAFLYNQLISLKWIDPNKIWLIHSKWVNSEPCF